MDVIFSEKKLAIEKLKICLRKIRVFLYMISKIFWYPFYLLFVFLKESFDNIYVKNYPRRNSINKCCLLVITTYSLIDILFVLVSFIIKRLEKSEILSSKQMIYLLISIPCIFIFYLIVKKLLQIYYYFRGQFQIYEYEHEATRQYIINKMPHLLKTDGDTGAGKDTLHAGIESVLVEYFNYKTIAEIEEIKEICYIIDFDKLDNDLLEHQELFITNSKEKIEEAFIGNEDKPGIATFNNCYIKKFYLKRKIVTPEGLVQDYYNFIRDPYSYQTPYSSGVRVQRKHFLQLIMFEYIEWFMRIYVEQNFLYSNQPKIESIHKSLMAKVFSLHFLRSKTQEKLILNKSTNKKEKKEEKVLFPFKDRIIISETECDTWYSNRSGDVDKDMLDGGIRDTKAYNRHYFKDFYWLQIGQAASRTNILLRELEHGYQHVYSRSEIEGGGTLWLEFKLNRILKKIAKIELKCSSKLSPKKEQKIEDLNNLYIASSNEKYKLKMDKIYKKTKSKPLPAKHYCLKAKVSELKAEIKNRKRDGFIKLIVCVSKNPSHPTEYTVQSLSQIMKDPTRVPTSFVGEFVFKMEQCETYDTHYMNSLSEKRSKDTVIKHAEVPRWPEHMKMTKREAMLLGYQACNDMFGITDKEVESLRFGDGINEYK